LCAPRVPGRATTRRPMAHPPADDTQILLAEPLHTAR
jgi:hypothetical protein